MSVKIFYTYAIKDHDPRSVLHDKIIEFLKSGGNVVDVYKFVFSETVEPGSEDADPTGTIKRIKNSDLFIGEMSRASQTLGFLMAFAVQSGKPSLYLYPVGSLGRPGKFITENPSRLITVEKYSDSGYEAKIREFLDRAKRKLASSRTTFVSTREIDDFISSKIKELGLSKGEVIRKIIEESSA